MKTKTIVFTSLGIVVIGVGAAIGYQQYDKSLNGNTNSNVSVQPANTNTADSNTVKPIKNNVIGTWIGTSTDSKTKLVITEDEYTEYGDGEETGRVKYKLLDEQTLELNIADKPVKAKATVEGDELTITANSKTNKYRRESGNPADTSANAVTVEDIRKKIIGTWKSEFENWNNKFEKFVFSENSYVLFSGDNVTQNYVYRVLDENNVETLNVDFSKAEIKIRFEDDNKTLVWGNQKFKRESNETQVSLAGVNQLVGGWVGIPGTISENKFLSIHFLEKDYLEPDYEGTIGFILWNANEKTRHTRKSLFSADGTIEPLYSRTDYKFVKLNVDGDTLSAIDKRGKKFDYKRNTVFDDSFSKLENTHQNIE